jgi:hypothetical protein
MEPPADRAEQEVVPDKLVDVEYLPEPVVRFWVGTIGTMIALLRFWGG